MTTLTDFGNFADLKAAFSDGIDAEEVQEIKAGLLEGYDLSDDTTEAAQEYIVEKAITVIEAIVNFFDKDKS